MMPSVEMSWVVLSSTGDQVGAEALEIRVIHDSKSVKNALAEDVKSDRSTEAGMP